MRVLDSHLHLWDPRAVRFTWLEGRFDRRFGPEELARSLSEVRDLSAHEFVFVQADCVAEDSLAEVDWVEGLSDAAAVRGIVAAAALEQGAAVDQHLDRLRERQLVVGVRRLLQSEPAGFALSSGFLAGARAVARAGLSFDACVREHQLPDVVALADEVPDLRIVLDHLGNPAVGSTAARRPPSAAWRRDLAELGRRPNVVCKLSGLPMDPSIGWDAGTIAPFFDEAIEAFGPERLLFGGDWPVTWPYAAWLEGVTEWLAPLGERVSDAILWSNTARAYRLAQTAPESSA